MRMKTPTEEEQKRFGKDPSYEKFIAGVNDTLRPLEEAGYVDDMPDQCTLHIVGVPRSGTTLTSQLIASSLDVGYINNLIAAFWRAPSTGIRLSKHLLANRKPATFESRFGRTFGIEEPHEFGYFWSELLNNFDRTVPTAEERAAVDWQRAKRIISNMAYTFGKPVLFKSFQLAWYMSDIQSVLPRTCFLWVRRDPIENAASLLAVRREMLGSVDEWLSFKPAEYEKLKEESNIAQVAGQVYYIEKAIRESMSEIENRNCLVLQYEELCENPAQAMEQVSELLREAGAPVDLDLSSLPSLCPRKPVTISDELREDLVREFARLSS